MNGFHYSREAGAEGQILTGEAEAPGLGLDVLCQREQPPLKVALAIGSALADILCIAAEDRMIHGDIRPEHVRVDTRGTVSIVGYGVARRATRAPEQRTDEHAVDVYGLGVVLHSILSPEPLGDLPREPDAHDDAVVTRVLDMDFSEVQGRRWLEEVQRFLCQILAWSPQDRPAPLDAANVLASVAAQCPGENIEVWAARVHTAAPARPAAPPPRPVEDLENLGGPVAIASPIAKGAVRQAPAAKGESTAFWSREKIAAMLAEDDDAPAPRREVVALPSTRTRDTTRDNMRPPDPPRQTPPPRLPDPSRIEDPGRSVVAQRPTEEPVRPPAPRPAQPAERPAPAPFANARIEASNPIDDEPPQKKGNAMLWVGVAIAVFVIGCGIVTLGGGGAWFMMGGGATAEAEKAAEEAREAAAKAEREAEEARKKAEEEAAKATADATGGAEATGGASGGGAPLGATPDGKATTTGGATNAAGAGGSASPASSGTSSGAKASSASGSGTSAGKSSSTGKTTTSSGKTGATGKTTSGGSTSAASPTPPAGAPFSVKFVTPGREGKLQCGDGQTAEFAGATTMSFTTTTTCLVRIGQGKGPAQVSKTATVTCTEDNGKVSCTGG